MTQRTQRAHRAALTAGLMAALTPFAVAFQDTAEPTEEVDEWTDLDREIQALDNLDFYDEPAAELWGYTRVSLFQQDDSSAAGVNLDNLRLNLTGSVSDYSYRITTDLAPGHLDLQDAWLSVPVGDQVAFTFGQFKFPMLRSGLVEARDLLLIARTRNGIYWSRRDQGVMANGHHGRFHWALAGQNGYDLEKDRWTMTASARVNVIGEQELPWEGAYGAHSLTRLTFGAGVSDDQASSNGTAVAVDAYLVHKRFSLQAEWLDYARDYTLVDPPEQRGSTSPWSVTASFMLQPDKVELAVRYDEFDDVHEPLDLRRRTLTLGINRYIEGHDLKWQLNYAAAHKGGDEDGLHDHVLALGVTASF